MRTDDEGSSYEIWTATYVSRTPKAILLDFGHVERWVPRSCLSEESLAEIDDFESGDTAEFEIVEWFADRELR